MQRVVLIALMIATALRAQPARTALAIIETPGAALVRANDSTELAAPVGELLADGDTLIATAPVTFVFCGAAGAGLRQTLSAGRVVMRAAGPDIARATLTMSQPVSGCALPDFDAGPDSAGLNDPEWEKTASPRSEGARAAPGELLDRVASAAALQKAGKRQQAAAAYLAISRDYQEEKWARRLALRVHLENRGAQGSGTTYAVLIGISQYSIAKPPLKFADKDAGLFRDFLTTTDRAKTISPRWKILDFYDAQATFGRLRPQMEAFLAQAGESDSILLYIAAHGITPGPRDPDQNDGYVVLYDSDPQNLRETALSMTMLKNMLLGYANKVDRVFLFVDTCHSNRIGDIKAGQNTINQRIAGTVASVKEHRVLAIRASDAHQLAYEHPRYGGGHGAFTYFLLRALNMSDTDPDYLEADVDQDAYVSITELAEYVRESVKKATGRNQIPMYDSRIPDFRVPVSAPGLRLPPYVAKQKAAASARPTAVAAGAPRKPDWDMPRAIEQQSALEEEGQRVLLRYLKGEEEPQTRPDFLHGVDVYRQALAAAGPSIFLEARLEFFLGRVAIFDRAYAEAVDHLQRSIRLDPAGAYAFNALGIAYLEQARYDRAEAALQDAIARAVHWAYPRHNLALVQLQRGDYSGAIATYREAMRLAPEYAYLPYNLGLVYRKLNRLEEAEAEFRAALAQNSWHAGPEIALATLMADRGRNAQAQALFDAAEQKLAAHPNRDFLRSLRHNKAAFLARRGDLDGARKLWQENIADGGYLPSRFALARALAARKDRASLLEAVAAYEAILVEAPKSISASLELASALERSGQFDRARSVLEHGLSTYPDHPDLVARLQQVAKRQAR